MVHFLHSFAFVSGVVQRSRGDRHLWTKRSGSSGVFTNHDFLPVGMIHVIGLESRIPQGSIIRRVRTIPITVLAKIAVTYMVVDPPAMESVSPGTIVVWG